MFEEAAAALAELGSDLAVDAAVVESPAAVLAADDLTGLAFAWLNELIGAAAEGSAALAGGRVCRVEERDGAWELEGVARLVRYGPGGAAFRRDVKAVTLHRLAVEEAAGGWTLTAYADL